MSTYIYRLFVFPFFILQVTRWFSFYLFLVVFTPWDFSLHLEAAVLRSNWNFPFDSSQRLTFEKVSFALSKFLHFALYAAYNGTVEITF